MVESTDGDILIACLHERLSYDPETGVLTWRDRPREHFPTEKAWRAWNEQRAARPVNAPGGANYLRVNLTVGGRKRILLSHRIAWAMVNGRWPPDEIDHINRNRADNRLANLREATHLENTTSWVETDRPDHLPAGINGIKVTLAESEKHELQRAADRAGMPVAVFTRVAALEKARGDATPPGTK